MSGKEGWGPRGAAWSAECPPRRGATATQLASCHMLAPSANIGKLKGGFKGKVIFHYKLVQQDIGLGGKTGYI